MCEHKDVTWHVCSAGFETWSTFSLLMFPAHLSRGVGAGVGGEVVSFSDTALELLCLQCKEKPKVQKQRVPGGPSGPNCWQHAPMSVKAFDLPGLGVLE